MSPIRGLRHPIAVASVQYTPKPGRVSARMGEEFAVAENAPNPANDPHPDYTNVVLVFKVDGNVHVR